MCCFMWMTNPGSTQTRARHFKSWFHYSEAIVCSLSSPRSSLHLSWYQGSTPEKISVKSQLLSQEMISVEAISPPSPTSAFVKCSATKIRPQTNVRISPPSYQEPPPSIFFGRMHADTSGTSTSVSPLLLDTCTKFG